MSRLLQNLVSAQADQTPDSVAIVLRDQTVSYLELEQRSNQLARVLKGAGCKRGDRVAFAIPKSPAALISILGILKADCIYVPIDTASPAARTEKILRSSEPRCILAARPAEGMLEDLLSRNTLLSLAGVGWMDHARLESDCFTPLFSWSDMLSSSFSPLPYQNRPEDAAHILYTSGSTGDPKGVVITHANVLHFVDWATRHFGMQAEDRISCHPPLHFDLAGFDIFGTFSVGAQLHLVPPDLGPLPTEVAQFIRDSQLTQWFSVPSVLHYMAKFDVVRLNDFPFLKRLLWCGEVFPTPALIYWMKRLPAVSFTNLYGPTEATIASSYYTIPECPADTAAPIPIGTACEGEELLVLDENHQPVPPGAIGDLYIRGAGLSPGYWKDATKTAQAFLPYPEGGHDRIYRTGDLAKLGSDGLVYFLGRSDSQIKSRGYRIELGEVEAALNTVDELKECAVVGVPTEGFEGTLICAAYVPRTPQVNNIMVQRKLSRLLPPYMLPARWISMDRLPKNANGKIDRRTIRELFASQKSSTPVASPPNSDLSIRAVVPKNRVTSPQHSFPTENSAVTIFERS